MIDLRLTGDADIGFADGEMQTVDGADEVLQAIRTELKTAEGEFFGDPDMGLDREYLLGKSYNAQYGAAAITNAISKDSRVISIRGVTLKRGAQRTLSAELAFTVDPTLSTDDLKMEVMIDA